jgi:hypothetical protein
VARGDRPLKVELFVEAYVVTRHPTTGALAAHRSEITT